MQEFRVKDVEYKSGFVLSHQYHKNKIPCKLYLLDGAKSLNTALRCRDVFLSFFNVLYGKTTCLSFEFNNKGVKDIKEPRLMIVFDSTNKAKHVDKGLELIKEFFDYTDQKLSYKRISKKTIIFNFESVEDMNILTFDYIILTLRQTFPSEGSKGRYNRFQFTYKKYQLMFNKRIHEQ